MERANRSLLLPTAGMFLSWHSFLRALPGLWLRLSFRRARPASQFRWSRLRQRDSLCSRFLRWRTAIGREIVRVERWQWRGGRLQESGDRTSRVAGGLFIRLRCLRVQRTRPGHEVGRKLFLRERGRVRGLAALRTPTQRREIWCVGAELGLANFVAQGEHAFENREIHDSMLLKEQR